MLEDPRINFAISTRGGKPGVDHLGLQTDTEDELAELKARAAAADMTLLDEGSVSCCYARSEKHWVTDPQGIAWEHFHTLADIPVFGEKAKPAEALNLRAARHAGARGKAIDIPVKQASCCWRTSGDSNLPGPTSGRPFASCCERLACPMTTSIRST